MCNTFSKLEENQMKHADGEYDKKFWDAMLNADSKDYERICAEFGVGDLDGILVKLEQRKREGAQNKDLVRKLSALRLTVLSWAISAEYEGATKYSSSSYHFRIVICR